MCGRGSQERLKLINGHRLVRGFILEFPTLVLVCKEGEGFASIQAESVQELMESF